MISNETEQRLVDALREAVNEAVRAGLSVGMVRSVVNDQLFGIEHLGKGDVDVMLKVAGEIDEEMRRKYT